MVSNKVKYNPYILILLSLVIAISCNQPTPIKLMDLKFGDFQKDKIAANNIDTVFLISKNKTLNLGMSDTIGYNTYDDFGNLLIEIRNIYGGHYIRYKYDSIGLMKFEDYSTDFSEKFQFSYKFIPDSMKLFQFRTSDRTDTCIFRFDNKGFLSEIIGYDNSSRGLLKTNYEYNSDNLLLKKTELHIITKSQLKSYEMVNNSSLSTKQITNFFYTKGSLDSTITIFYYRTNPNHNDISKTFYDNNGLRKKTICNDSLITTYIYKKR